MSSLAEALERELRGEARFDAGHRAIYAHDSSNYRQTPLGVVLPRDAADVEAAVAICRAFDAPVLPRGCGTSLSGETVNRAVVLDTSRHMRAIREIDPDRRTARVEPGVIRDQLAHPCEERYDLTFAPDTSTHAYATFGGMIGNNSCGVHSVMAGRTADNVAELDVVTYDGLRMRVGATSDEQLDAIVAAGGRRGELYAGMRDLRDRYADEIRRRFPDIPRRVSGYNLDELLPEKGFNVARLLVGSEGTLATTLEATVQLVHSPPGRALVVIGYRDVFAAGDHVPAVLAEGPVGLEGLDARLVREMGLHGLHEDDLRLLPDGDAWLLAEFGADSQDEAVERARDALGRLEGDDAIVASEVVERPAREHRVWEVRESGLGASAYHPTERDHWPGWEDAAVPPERVGDYLRDFQGLLDEHGYHAGLYGHFGDGCIHCRIDFDLKSAGGLRRWRTFMEEAARLVVSHGGSLSGEHGDGQQRAELLPIMYGEEIVRAFGELKALWDPDNRMNPNKVVDPAPIVSNLRLGTDYNPADPPTHFAYPEDGGSFAHAAMRCVGAGKCRDTDSGTMCPSYMVTLEEEHTTRGRARVLHEMLVGDTITDGFRSTEVHDALDLCLSCKGCKGDCPVNVDMATYKAEFLARHFKRRLRPRAAYSMGLIMLHARLAARAPRLVNALTHTPVLGDLLKRAGGLTTERELPRFARETFFAWWEGRGTVNPGGEPVVLFPDTFNAFLHPGVLRATVEVLESAGRRVIVPDAPVCCGRPLYDYGMLPTARRFLERLVETLRPHVRAGTPIVGAEPSCVAVFRDELPNMLPNDEDAKRLSLQTLTLAEFLMRRCKDWDAPQLDRRAIVQGHCHHKAVMKFAEDQRLLRRLGLDFEVLDAGCCGLAGSFGFEASKHDVSVAIANRRLVPAVEDVDAETLVIADGFSCKTQIEQLTGRRALHLAEVIRLAAREETGAAASRVPAGAAGA